MDSFISCVLQNTLVTHEDVFGKKCAYIAFHTTNGESFSWSSGFKSKGLFGRILYRREDDKEQYSDDLVVKTTPVFQFPNKNLSMLPFINEVFFYSRILPFYANFNADILNLFPKYYNSLLQHNSKSDEVFIVFENLQAKGYRSSLKKSFLDYDHLSLMMRKLGRFHAYSYHAREQNPRDFHSMIQCALKTNPIIWGLEETTPVTLRRGAEPILNDPDYNVEREKILNMIDNGLERILAVYTDGNTNTYTRVLCHGDFLRGNMLFKYDAMDKPIDLKIVDLGDWIFTSSALDVALVLYVNADQQMRDEHWDDLIDEYYTSLRSTFPSTEVPSRESILAEFKTVATAAYFIASFFLPYVVTDDNGDVVSEEYQDSTILRHSIQQLMEMSAATGGEKVTIAITNVLKDIINRGFL